VAAGFIRMPATAPAVWVEPNQGMPDVRAASGRNCHDSDREVIMGMEEKARAMAEQAKGKVKEAVGKVTDDERLEAEGKVDQGVGDLRETKENVKDALRD